MNTLKSILLLLFLSVSLFAGDAAITIKWEIPKKSDIEGYYFYLESESGVTYKSDIGLRNSHSFEVIPNKTYKIFIVPYGKNKVDGKQSNVIYYTHKIEIKEDLLPKPLIRISQ